MSVRRESASFLREAVVGLAMSAAAAATGSTLMLVADTDTATRVVVAGLGLTYLLRLLGRSSERTGRSVTVAVWAGAAAVAWVADPGLPAYVALHVSMLWLARSLYGYTNLVEAALDLGLTALAACFAVWAAVRADSLFLTVWCFFVLQALHVSIPALAERLSVGAGAADGRADAAGDGRAGAADFDAAAANRRFAHAWRAADEALRRMASRR